MTTSEIKAAPNDQLLEAYSLVSIERHLASSDHHDYEDYPLSDRFDLEEKTLLYEYEARLVDEIKDRMADDARLKRLDSLKESITGLADALELYNAKGLPRDMMVYWMHHKSGINVTDIRKLLDSQEDFFDAITK